MQILLLTFDRLPLRMLSPYGNEWIETPNFERLAARTVVFDQHFAENLDPAAANHAWWTGTHQFPRAPDEQRSLPTLMEPLHAAGIGTRLLVETRAKESTGSLPAFEHMTEVAGLDGLDAGPAEIPFAELIRQGCSAVRELAADDTPRLLWLKSAGVPWPEFPPQDEALRYLEPVEDLESTDRETPAAELLPEDEIDIEGGILSLRCTPGEFETVLQILHEAAAEGAQPLDLTPRQWQIARRIYAGYVGLLDRWLGELLDVFHEVFPDRECLLIVTAARGESLGERAVLPMGSDVLREEVVHTPLFVGCPGEEMGTRRPSLVQTVDLVPTILDWFNVTLPQYPPSQGGEAGSLLPLVRNEQRDIREYLYLGRGAEACAVRTRDFYLVSSGSQESADVFPPRPALFVKPDDVWDVNDTASQSPDDVERLEALLKDFLDRSRADQPSDR